MLHSWSAAGIRCLHSPLYVSCSSVPLKEANTQAAQQCCCAGNSTLDRVLGFGSALTAHPHIEPARDGQKERLIIWKWIRWASLAGGPQSDRVAHGLLLAHLGSCLPDMEALLTRCDAASATVSSLAC